LQSSTPTLGPSPQAPARRAKDTKFENECCTRTLQFEVNRQETSASLFCGNNFHASTPLLHT
jgi:hypothetical protein